MKERIENKTANRWLSECQQDGACDEKSKNYNKEKAADVYHDISHAPKEKDDFLKELASAENCTRLLRSAAIDRLIDNDPTVDSIIFLRELYMDQKREENVRSNAYKSYRYLRVKIGLPSSKDEREHEKSLLRNDSPRMQWLMSLKD